MIFACPGSQKFRHPFPEELKCLSCGGEVEIWTDEITASCPHCRAVVARQPEQGCFKWCKHANECIGGSLQAKNALQYIRRSI